MIDFIGDWVDEYCDLTMEKFISEYKKFDPNIEVTHPIADFQHIDDIESLKQTINSLVFDSDKGIYVAIPKKNILKRFINKIKRLFN